MRAVTLLILTNGQQIGLRDLPLSPRYYGPRILAASAFRISGVSKRHFVLERKPLSRWAVD